MGDLAGIIKESARLIGSDNIPAAQFLLKESYPFHPREKLAKAVSEMGLPTPTAKQTREGSSGKNAKSSRRKIPVREALAIFARDSFRCSYSGQRLVLPPALVLLSTIVPQEFPCKNYPRCPLAETHIAFWALSPSPDHVDAFSGGGECVSENLVTSSSAVNMFKSNWSLTELGWPQPRSFPNPDGWDGLGQWFVDMLEANADLRNVEEHRAFFDGWLLALKDQNFKI